MKPYVNDPETIRLAKEGDSLATERVVSTNLGLVKSIALRFTGRGAEFEDLVQIGTIGMLKAIRGFDPQKECKFTTYAVPHIMGEIKRFLRSDGWIKVGRDLKSNAARIFRFTEEYEKEKGVSPTLEEIALGTGISEESVVLAMESSRPALSLYGKDEESGLSPEEVVGEDRMDDALNTIALRQAVERLEPGERLLITLRYYKALTQEQTAKMMGITQVKVSREEKKILEKLRLDFTA